MNRSSIAPRGGGQTLIAVIAKEPRRSTPDLVLGNRIVLVSAISWNESINWGVARFAGTDATTIDRIGDTASLLSGTIAREVVTGGDGSGPGACDSPCATCRRCQDSPGACQPERVLARYVCE